MTQEELDRIIEKHQHWINQDCADCENMRADLSYEDISGRNISGKNLTGAILAGTDMRRCDISGTKLVNADMRDSNMEQAYLCGTDMRGACMSGAKIDSAWIDRYTKFQGTDLRGTMFLPIYTRSKLTAKSMIRQLIVFLIMASITSVLTYSAHLPLVEAIVAWFFIMSFVMAVLSIEDENYQNGVEREKVNEIETFWNYINLTKNGVADTSKLADVYENGSLYATIENIRHLIAKKYIKEEWYCERTGKVRMIESEKTEDADKTKNAEGQKDNKAEINRYIQMLQDYSDRINEDSVTAKINDIKASTAQILTYNEKHPESRNRTRKVFSYYLPTMMKILDAYSDIESQKITGNSADAVRKDTIKALDMISVSFKNLINGLVENDCIYISSDVSVMEVILKQDGLLEEHGI